MPTGYTAELYEGEQSFEDFVWRVARGMGALYSMRDSPLDAEVPERFEPSTDYHDKALAKAEATLARLKTITTEQAQAEANDVHAAMVESRRESVERTAALRGRYEAMLEHVRAWEPPTPDHVGLRDYMIEQLTESIEFDCGGYDRWPKTQRLTAKEWIEQERSSAERDVAYHTAERAKEVERVESCTAWVQALRKSLQGAIA